MKLSEMLKSRNIKFRCNEPMSAHTYYRIGGPAEYFVTPENKEQLCEVIDACKRADKEYFILGKGSNLLVSDNGYNGCIIDMSEYIRSFSFEGNILKAQSGTSMSILGNAAEQEGLSGLEELRGVPGTLGGALQMNAGCYGKEISELVLSVKVLKNGEISEIPGTSIKWGYRSSSLKGGIILSAELKLKKSIREKVKESSENIRKIRAEKQPVDLPSCGSVFKRPEGNYAAKLIEDAGLKGMRSGNAQISEKHAGFIVNLGNAKASDVRDIIEITKKKVSEKTGIELNEEVIYLGFSGEVR